MKKLFKNRSFTLLFAGGLVSNIGNELFLFAVGLYILDITGSGLSMSIFIALGFGFKTLFSPVAGVLIDRWNKVKILYITDFIRGFLFVTAGIIMASGISPQESIILLYIITIFLAINVALFEPAVLSAVPEIVGDDMVQVATGAQSTVMSIQTVIGLLAGAIIYTILGIEWVIAINALSFLLSGFSEMFIKTRYKIERKGITEENKKTVLGDFKVGINHLINKEGLISYVLFTLKLNIIYIPFIFVGIPFLYNTALGRPPIELANVQIVFAVSAFIGGIVIGQMKIKNTFLAVGKGFSLIAIGFVCMAIISYLVINQHINYWVFYIVFLLLAATVSMGLTTAYIIMITGITKAVDPEFRGRTFSTIRAINQSAATLFLIIGGLIIDFLDIATFLISASGLLVVFIIQFFKSKQIKKLLDGIQNRGVKEIIVD